MELPYVFIIGALWTLLCAVVGFMLKSALQRIGLLEKEVSKKVSQEKCDLIQVSNAQEFRSIYKHNDDKFNRVMETIKDSSDKLEKKIDKLSDSLTTHIIEHHGS